ncbi:MAG: hypothetical protein CSA66_04300 [Proteobacteria bacterium]|nr:MAG: hypothetical protein CSA66_04300 [Pseudomonadota bacterium]
MQLLVAFLVGTLFAVGLGVAGMTQPGKVVGFLNLAGDWDPSLMFVMLGAILVYMPGLHLLLRKREHPLLAPRFQLPTRRDITPRLVGGAALFGVGWGLAGFCPGPAIAANATGTSKIAVFMVAMVAGMLLFNVVDAALSRRAAAAKARVEPPAAQRQAEATS